MPEDRVYEIEIRVRSATDEAVRHLEGPLPYASANDVALDLSNDLGTKSDGRMRKTSGTDR